MFFNLSFVVLASGRDHAGAVELFEENDAGKIVWECHGPKGEDDVCTFADGSS